MKTREKNISIRPGPGFDIPVPGGLVPAGLTRPAPRARSLILTVWGDSVMPHGGRVWLGSLIRLLAPLGLDERLVRTSVQRLIADGWLQTEAFGRRRDILMRDAGEIETRAVQARMYTTRPVGWDGCWHMILTAARTPARREALRRELGWAGYMGFSPNQFIASRDRWPELQARLVVKDLTDDVAYRFRARFDGDTPPPIDLWPVAEVGGEWQALTDDLGDLLGRITTAPPNGAIAFALRSLAVHAYRRLVVKDPDLPPDMLPGDWAAPRARQAFADVWHALQPAADAFTSSVIERCDGVSLPTGDLYPDRFPPV